MFDKIFLYLWLVLISAWVGSFDLCAANSILLSRPWIAMYFYVNTAACFAVALFSSENVMKIWQERK